MKRVIEIALIALLLSIPESVGAWVIQPLRADNVDASDLAAFEENSARTLAAIGELFSALASSEAGQSPLNSDQLLEIAGNIQKASDIFKSLGDSSLNNLKPNWEALSNSELSTAVDYVLENFPMADAAQWSTQLSEILGSMAANIRSLAESKLSPENPADPIGRAAFNELMDDIYFFNVVGNTATAAFAAQ